MERVKEKASEERDYPKEHIFADGAIGKYINKPRFSPRSSLSAFRPGNGTR